MSALHIHAPQPSMRRILAAKCLDCKKRSRFVAFFTEWYGWDQTCLRCGRRWSDGYWMPLEFYRFARRNNINAAKKQWRNYREAA